MSDARESLLSQFRTVIGMIMHLSMQNFMQFSRSQGISLSQMGALRHIYHRANCNISDISEEMGISTAAASQMLDRLVQSGLITRTENPQDRRNRHLEVTEKGDQILHDGFLSRQAWLVEMVQSLSPAEEIKIKEALDILAEKISRIEEEKHESPLPSQNR